MQHFIELAVIFRKAGAIGLRVPEMQDAGCKPAVLATNAGPDETDEQIGVLPAPTAERGVEPVDLFEIRTPERHVAAASPAPAPRRQFAHSAKMQLQQRCETIELTAQARYQPACKPPPFWLKRLMENALGQVL